MLEAAYKDTLFVIADEMKLTLGDIKSALELAIDSDDGKHLSMVRELLASAKGALLVINFSATVLLATEMLKVVDLLLEGKVGKREAALDALSSGVLLLPAFFSKTVESGGREQPIILLPVLQELRAVRKAKPLSEAAFLLLDSRRVALSDTPIELPKRGKFKKDLRQQIKKYRPAFQSALLGWIKGQKSRQHLARLAVICEKFAQAAEHERAYKVWWITRGLIEALTENGLRSSTGLRRLVAQVDSLGKTILEQGEEFYQHNSDPALVNELLSFISHSGSSGKHITEIRKAFNQAKPLTPDEQLAEAKVAMAAPDTGVMHSLVLAIREDLDKVKDTLDIFNRTGTKDSLDIEKRFASLKKIADTLQMLGLSGLEERVLQQQQEITQLLSRNEPLTEDHLISVAASLLKVESQLEEELDKLGGKQKKAQPKYLLSALEGSFRESKINLARVKEVIGQYMRDPTDLKPISRAPLLLKEARAASLLADKQRLAVILGRLQEYITRQLIASGRLPYPEHLDLLAGAIESVDFYLETLNKGRRDPWYMLENAETCLEQLFRDAPATLIRPEDDPQGQALERTLPLSRPGKPATGTVEIPGLTPDAPKRTPKPDDAPVKTHPDAYPVMDASLETTPEVIEVFIEEANEVQLSIEREFRAWRADKTQRAAMVSVRRGFHTLKGSGRMVGAKRLSELAWQAEHLINRFLEGTIKLDEDGLHLLERVVAVIPVLIEQLEIGAETKEDAHQLMLSLESFTAQKLHPQVDRNDISHLPGQIETATGIADTQGKQTVTPGQNVSGPDLGELALVSELLDPETSGKLIDTADWMLVQEAGEAAVSQAPGFEKSPASHSDAAKHYQLEPALYDIYRDETARHLAVIRAFCADSLDTPISSDMHRAVHTLHGSAHMADLAPIMDLTAAFEHYIQRLYDENLAIDHAAGIVVAEVIDSVERMVASVNQPQAMPEASAELIRKLHDLRASVDQRVLEKTFMPADLSATMNLSHEPRQPSAPPSPASSAARRASPETKELLGELEVELDDILIVADADLGEEDIVLASDPTLGAVDTEITDIFLEEAQEVLAATDAAFAQWDKTSLPDVVNTELQRQLHTLKGGARMAGLLSIGDFTHETESFIIGLRDAPALHTGRAKKLLRAALDHMHKMLDDVQKGVPPAQEKAVLDAMQALTRGSVAAELEGVDLERADFEPVDLGSVDIGSGVPDAASGGLDSGDIFDETLFFETYAEEALPPLGPETGTRAHALPAHAVSTNEPGSALEKQLPVDPGSIFAYASQGASAPARQQDAARISSNNLETLLNQAGEISIFRSRIEQELSSSNLNLAELARTVQRVKQQLRKMEIETEATILYQHRDETERDDFDPLEMDRYSNVQQVSRALAESVNDLSSLESLLENQFRDTEALLLQQSRVMTDLQDNLMRVRMVPFARYAPRYARIVRQIATETGKEVELNVVGAESEIDRQVIERMQAPLEHMIRNAVIHGIESPDERRAAGKDPEGSIDLHLSREGAQLLLELKDDGAGLDFARIRAKALEIGLLTPDQGVSDADLAQLILNAGLSTAETITQSAGRGVGMDVVASEVKQLGGSLQILSETGKGTRFLMRLPFTRAINHALMVRVGDENYAIPLHKIDGVAKMPVLEVRRLLATEQPVYRYANLDYEVKNLSELVGSGHLALEPDATELSLIMVTGGDHHAAILVSELLGSREMIIKPVGPQVAAIRGISGATILGDGRIVVILDMDALLSVQLHEIKAREVPVPTAVSQPLILVVDDSITVRRVTERLLERNKIQVLTARDGLDALTVLQDHLPDLILLDIEMPRMDGYELAEHVRKDQRTQGIPIIMITSRTGDKHRSRAIKIGVDDYLGKPYREDQLLNAIKPLLAAQHVA